ncbi:MAG: hypothetical protein IH956_01370 [Chloroflexi bacterium]|nr:hypothetical protein [Chloroflexota bacterium]
MNMASTGTRELAKQRGRGGQPRNDNAQKHGLYTRDKDSLKLRARAVRRLVAKAYELCPWLTATDRPTVQAWAEIVKLKSVCFMALERSNPYRLVDGDLVGRRLLQDYGRLAGLELAYAKELGLTPQSRVSLGIDLAKGLDLAAEAARLRANGGSDD